MLKAMERSMGRRMRVLKASRIAFLFEKAIRQFYIKMLEAERYAETCMKCKDAKR